MFTEKMRKSIRRQAGDKRGVAIDLLDEIDRLEKALKDIHEVYITCDFEHAAMNMDMIVQHTLDRKK